MIISPPRDWHSRRIWIQTFLPSFCQQESFLKFFWKSFCQQALSLETWSHLFLTSFPVSCFLRTFSVSCLNTFSVSCLRTFSVSFQIFFDVSFSIFGLSLSVFCFCLRKIFAFSTPLKLFVEDSTLERLQSLEGGLQGSPSGWRRWIWTMSWRWPGTDEKY